MAAHETDHRLFLGPEHFDRQAVVRLYARDQAQRLAEVVAVFNVGNSAAQTATSRSALLLN